MDSEDEHSPSALRHSEVASVKSPVGPHIPEFFQTTAECSHVPTTMTGEQSRNVLEEDDGRSVSLHKVEEAKGEAGALASETLSLASNAEVLTGEAACPENSASGMLPSVGVTSGSLRPSVPVPTSQWNTDKPALALDMVVSDVLPCEGADASEIWDSRPSLAEFR